MITNEPQDNLRNRFLCLFEFGRWPKPEKSNPPRIGGSRETLSSAFASKGKIILIISWKWVQTFGKFSCF
jgi:hypothetical protein